MAAWRNLRCVGFMACADEALSGVVHMYSPVLSNVSKTYLTAYSPLQMHGKLLALLHRQCSSMMS